MSHPVDVHVGKRIRHRRWMNGVTQQQLAEKVGIKFQQIQKYETGMNRVSASRLWDIAAVLTVDVSFFFEGLDDAKAADMNDNDLPSDILTDKEALELLRSYYAIPENQRRRLFDLARALSDAATGPDGRLEPVVCWGYDPAAQGGHLDRDLLDQVSDVVPIWVCARLGSMRS